MYHDVTDIRSKIPVVYRIFRISHSSPLQFDIGIFNQSMIHAGLCFPKACSDIDAGEIGRKILVPLTFNDFNLYGNVSFKSSRVLGIRDNLMNENFVKIFM